MFKLDKQFLEEVGLSAMPEEQQGAFLEHVQGQLEEKVGEKIVEGLTDEQLEEARLILTGDAAAIDQVLAETPEYENDPAYQGFIDAGMVAGSPELKEQFATYKWLEKNKPDYQETVQSIMDQLKQDIESNKDQILGTA